jgi:saccharopine dehydrogenase (NADP+, L-glutamate forming)
LYAVKTIDEVHKAGGRVTSFLSYCGGLPAPECSDNPLGYKFSWSSRGVLLALKNQARYYKDGKIVDVSSEELMGTAKPYHTGFQGYAFVAYPNRDSTPCECSRFYQAHILTKLQTENDTRSQSAIPSFGAH